MYDLLSSHHSSLSIASIDCLFHDCNQKLRSPVPKRRCWECVKIGASSTYAGRAARLSDLNLDIRSTLM